jgi:hypothetical protein
MNTEDRWTDGSMKTLDELLRACLLSDGTAVFVRVLIQDEFTQDVIVRQGPRWLVYDCT